MQVQPKVSGLFLTYVLSSAGPADSYNGYLWLPESIERKTMYKKKFSPKFSFLCRYVDVDKMHNMGKHNNA